MIHLNIEDVSLRAESRLTEHCQTTIPAAICDALHLKPGELIEYLLLPGGKVIISRQETEQNDPLISEFLSFLETDMKQNPQHIKPVPKKLWAEVKELTVGVEVDLDAPLTDTD